MNSSKHSYLLGNFKSFISDFQEMTKNPNPQTKAIFSIAISLLIGLSLYSFVSNPLVQMVIIIIITFIAILIIYRLTSSRETLYILIIGFCIGTIIWLHIFYGNYKLQNEEKKYGKQSFICSPNGTCSKDGIKGAFNGEKQYIFNPPNKPGDKMDNGIPHQYFDVRNKDQYTYMFWLNIDYNKWKANRDKRSIILLKGNNVDTSDLVVWGLPTDNLLQFKIKGITGKPIIMNTDFPFDKWVHYTVVVNQRVAELYKNATLEKSAVINGMVNLSKTPLYIGFVPDNSYQFFPGQMIFLTYHNYALNPEDIYKIYDAEYNILSSQPNSWNKIPAGKDETCKNYKEDCQSKDTSQTKSSLENKPDKDNNNSTKNVHITPPSEYLKNLF